MNKWSATFIEINICWKKIEIDKWDNVNQIYDFNSLYVLFDNVSVVI